MSPELPADRPAIFIGGALLAVDVGWVDRLWSEMPAREVLEGIAGRSLRPKQPTSDTPGETQEADFTGLDVAVRAFTSKKHLDRPLVENVQAKRALGVPWKWFAYVPDPAEERRLDSRLLKIAEVTRVPSLSAADILAVTSVVEQDMVGADEAPQAFARWSSSEFAERLEKTSTERTHVERTLMEAWGSSEPLLAALEVEDENALWDNVHDTLERVIALTRFARDQSLKIVPRTKTHWKQWLQERSQQRFHKVVT